MVLCLGAPTTMPEDIALIVVPLIVIGDPPTENVKSLTMKVPGENSVAVTTFPEIVKAACI
jgi:hypothetical protein